VTTEDDKPLGIALRATGTRAELLFGPIDDRHRIGDDLAAEVERAEKIELLARRVESKPVALRFRERRRLGIVIDCILFAVFDQRQLGTGSERPVILTPAVDRGGGAPGDTGADESERQSTLPAGHVLPEPPQGQRVDARVVVGGRSAKGLDIG